MLYQSSDRDDGFFCNYCSHVICDPVELVPILATVDNPGWLTPHNTFDSSNDGELLLGLFCNVVCTLAGQRAVAKVLSLLVMAAVTRA